MVMDTPVTKEEVCYLCRSPGTEAWHATWDHSGMSQGGQQAEGGARVPQLSCGFCWKEHGGQA